jgi:autotransporter-associated beta strand protein
MKRDMKTNPVSLLLCARMRGMAFAALCLLPAPALLHAQTWTGATSQWWNDPANWKGGLPVSGPNTLLSFEGGTRLGLNNNLADPFLLQTLFFGSTAPTFQLAGSPLAFAANGQLVQNGGNEQILQNKILVNSDLTIGGIGSGAITFMGGLEGSGHIVKSGAFDLRLQAGNPGYTGTLQVDAGRVVVAHAFALQNSTVQLNVANGLAFGTGNATLGGLSGSGNFSFGSANLAVGANNANTTYSGSIANGGVSSFSKVGTGTLTLTGVSAYGGATIVQDGTLVVQAGGQIGSGAHPVSIGGNLLNPGDGALIVDGPGSRVSGSVFNIDSFGSLTLRNSGTLAGPNGQRPSLVISGGAFTGYGTFDATLQDGPRIIATAPLTFHMQSEQFDGELFVQGTTLTIHAPGPQLLYAVTTLDSSNGLATIHAPNGLTLAPGGQLHGRGAIRGAFTDQTAGANIGLLSREFLVLTNPDFGSDHWTFLNYLPKADHVTIDGGQVDTLGETFAFGTSITGHGAIVAPVTNILVGGISNGGPSTVTLTGDLALGTTAPRFESDLNRFLRTTFNIGPHRFTPVGRTMIEDSAIHLAGGTFFAPQLSEEDLSTTSISGFGMLITRPSSELLAPSVPVATGSLAAANDLVIPGNQLVQLISNAPTPVMNVQLQGGQVVAKGEFLFNGPTGISGYGLVDGPTSGPLATPLVATAPLPVYAGIIRSSDAHVLSTTPTLWNSGIGVQYLGFTTVPPSGTTVHAPAGLILAATGGGGPVTIQAPAVSFADVARVEFASTTIHGAVDFGASEILSLPNLTVTGPSTMHGATLHDVSGWSLATPLTGNGFVFGPTPAGLTFAPQGSAPAGRFLDSLPADLLVVSETPYTLHGSGSAIRGWCRGTNGLIFEGDFRLPVDARAEGIFRANGVDIWTGDVFGNPGQYHVTLGQAGVADAVEIADLEGIHADITFESSTPIKLGYASFHVLTDVHSETELHVSTLRLFGSLERGVTIDAAAKGDSFLAFSLNGMAAHSLVSLDFAEGHVSNTRITLAGFPDGSPALLPREGSFRNAWLTAPQGMMLREHSVTDVNGVSFRGKLILDGRIWSSEGSEPDICGTLTGHGLVDVAARLVGAEAQLNPGAIGATGLLTVKDLSMIPDPANVSAGVGEWVFELGPNDSDRLVVTGNLTLDGGLSVSLLDNLALGPGLNFPIIDVQGSLSGTFAGLAEGDTVANFGGWDLHVSYSGGNGNDVVLYTVPEPSAAIYLAGLGVILLGTRRRK